MQKPSVSKIYLDLDGVVSDFAKKYKALYDMDPKEAVKHKKFDVLWQNFIDNSTHSCYSCLIVTNAMITLLSHHR